MAYFAKLDENNNVLEVHTVHNNELLDENGVESEEKGIQFLKNIFQTPNSIWKKVSYNTMGGIYYTPNSSGIREVDPDQTKAFRKNYPGKDFIYDEIRDAFIPPKPYPSWILDEQSCLWVSSIPKPNDNKAYDWDESTLSWKENVLFS
jgi:hypothetical protein